MTIAQRRRAIRRRNHRRPLAWSLAFTVAAIAAIYLIRGAT